MILKVQRSVVSLCREDANLSLDKLHRITEDGLRDGLKSLGFNMEGNVSLVTAGCLFVGSTNACRLSRYCSPIMLVTLSVWTFMMLLDILERDD